MADFGVGAPIVVQAAGPAVVSPNPVIPIITVPVPGPPGQSGAGGEVDTVTGPVVDNTDPANPVVNADPEGAAASAQADAQDYADTAINTAIGMEITRANSAYDVLGAAASAQAAAIAASQPVDSDLTAIAALTTTVFGRSLLTAADAAALRTAAALGTSATHPATDFDTAGAAATAQSAAIAAAAADATTKANAAQAASQPLDSDLTAIAALTTTSYGRAFLTLGDAAAARTALGLGTLATQSGTFSGASSGTNTGDQDLSSLAPKASPALTGSPTVNGNALSGANTGDETGATIRSKLGVTTLSGSNTGDQTISVTGDVTASGSTGALASTVGKINGTSLAGLATGLLKNTTATGVPSIATAADIPTVAAGGTGALGATQAIPESQVTNLTSDLALLAPLASPALTGTPTVPTAAAATNTTQAASTAFVTAAVAAGTSTAVAGSYGDGSDGNVSISTTVTLTRDMFYDTLTVTGTGVLKPSSFRVYCKTACNVQASGVIQANGGASATTGAGGAGGGAGTLGQGKAGAAGGTGVGGTGSVSSNSLGGIGGNGGSGTPNAGGVAVTPTAIAATNGELRTLPQASIGLAIGTTTSQANGGGAGAAGGGDGVNAGGGGGGGGGVIIINARSINNQGTISVTGGNGGSPTVGNCGGGGGGGGGLVIINSASALVGNAPTSGGGTGGTKFGTGVNGSNGSTGTVRQNVWA